MLIFRVNGTDYKAVEKWEELTLETALQVLAIPIPENLKLIYEGTEVEPSTEDKLKHFPTYYGEVLKVLTDIPEQIIDNIYSEDREEAYKTIERLVIGLHFAPDYEVKGIKSFKIEDEVCELPTHKVLLGQEKPFSDCEAIEFVESTDLRIRGAKLEEGEYKYAPEFIAILCRPKGEKYNEEVCMKRAESMKKLTMDIVFEVFFCTIKRFSLLRKHTVTSSLLQGLRSVRKSRQVASKAGAGMVGS